MCPCWNLNAHLPQMGRMNIFKRIVEQRRMENYIRTPLHSSCLSRELENRRKWTVTLELSSEVTEDEPKILEPPDGPLKGLSEQRMIQGLDDIVLFADVEVNSGITYRRVWIWWGTMNIFLLRVWSLHSCFSVNQAIFRPAFLHLKLLLLQGGRTEPIVTSSVLVQSLPLLIVAYPWRHSDVTAVDLTAWAGPGMDGGKEEEQGAGLGEAKGLNLDQP